ncbi:hypothetical protein [Pedobacter cryoconitis]|uniref:hypothetical protein n=1 Tax=Pedobacter cryoconitis TaxID=188932 RepID=UPI00161B29F0|nr:hypothetical protein [Pedobacter cryoconitis]MBB5646979.1 hypothetical protein [Pedobacter cryoconitis]
MEYTFNELSLETQSPLTESEVLEFASICIALFSKGFRILKIADRKQLLSHPLTTYASIGEWVKSDHKNLEQRVLIQKFKSILAASSKVMDSASVELINACPLIYINIGGNQVSPKGLKVACILKTFCISFNLAQGWTLPMVAALWVEEDDGIGIIEQHVDIRHVGEVLHLKYHEDWMLLQLKSNKLFSGWNPYKEYFPNLNYSDELVKDGNWDEFRDKCRNISTELRRAMIIDFGKKVAERNNYIYDQKLSALNTSDAKKRVIYHAGSSKQRIYLSIDMETGGFEVCDYMGFHLGEYFYDGTKTKEATSGHSIIVC